MNRAFRIARRKHARDAFSGEGARLAGGRWNSPGRRVVYLSTTLSLAALEVFVHLAEEAIALDFVYFEISIPDRIPMEVLSRRPRGWNAEPPGVASMASGDAWLLRGASALLQVPSIIVPTENNVLLNPLHPDAAALKISPARPFRFDPRLWKE